MHLGCIFSECILSRCLDTRAADFTPAKINPKMGCSSIGSKDWLLIFSSIFSVCEIDCRQVPFRSAPESFLTTFVMTLGEVGKADIFESTSLEPFLDVSYFLFVTFLFMMPMVLVNLTVRKLVQIMYWHCKHRQWMTLTVAS